VRPGIHSALAPNGVVDGDGHIQRYGNSTPAGAQARSDVLASFFDRETLMLLLLPFLLVLGLLLPGFFYARYTRLPLPWAAGFSLSLVVLFHMVFWLGILRVAITLWTVLPGILVLSPVMGWLARRSQPVPVKPPELGKWDRMLLISSRVVGLALLARSAVSPLIGFDTRFRWDFLAQKILALGRFDFYPPLTPADFRTYFYVDGIPPMVSFIHWWMYASAGQYMPVLICLFVTAQFVCTLAFTYRAASALFSARAGVLAAALLAASPLFFRSVVLGQETGLTALSVAAMICFIVTAETGSISAMIAAGLAAGLCALSREYGWIALICGLIALAWRKHAHRQIVVFAATTLVAALPWYVRNWMIAGNPVYSLSLGGFAVNPIHAGILRQYNAVLGLPRWNATTWTSLVWLLLTYATFQILAGIPGGLVQFRKNGYLLVIAVLLSAVWIQSAGYTSGGVVISTRVLNPTVVILSITGAGLLASLTRKERSYPAIAAAILLCQFWTAAHGALYPANPADIPIGEWAQKAFHEVPPETEFQIGDRLAASLPAGSRILSDSAHLHAALAAKGIDVVPVWSPEVRFLFTAPAEESERRLKELHIDRLAYYPKSLNTLYLNSASPFYAALPHRWHVLGQVPGSFYLVGP
jgi:hypothetical protein